MIRPPTAWQLALVVALTACSHQGRCSKVEVTVVGDPDHTTKISADAVKRAEAATYRVRGPHHEHVFSLSAEDMQALALGKTVTVRTSSMNAHVHDVTVRCQD